MDRSALAARLGALLILIRRWAMTRDDKQAPPANERVLFMMIRAAAFTTARVAFALATAREWLAQEGVM